MANPDPVETVPDDGEQTGPSQDGMLVSQLPPEDERGKEIGR